MDKLIQWDNPEIGDEEVEAATSSLRETIGAKGHNISALQNEIKSRLGVRFAFCVNNGTSALLAACLALKHKFGPLKVAVPSFSFIASANAPQFVFDDIEFTDVDPFTWNITSNAVPAKADLIMAVDVAGLPCDYDELRALGKLVVGDSAESLGSRYKGDLIGGQADIHCFSLHRSKIITCGEGGIVTTNDEELASYIESYISHGYDRDKRSWEYKHSTLGLNFRMTDIEAAIARVQLRKLDKFVEHRNKLAKIYSDELSDRFELQEFDRQVYQSNYFMFGIVDRGQSNANIIEHLNRQNIVAKAWASIAGQPCYGRVDPAVSKLLADHMVLLPIANATTESEVERVITAVKGL